MNLTIINDDGALYVDGIALAGLDLSTTGIPTNVHALQWKTNLGWIEFKENSDFSKDQNQVINVLPNWANNCVTVYNNRVAEIQAQQAESEAKAKISQPTTIGTQTL